MNWLYAGGIDSDSSWPVIHQVPIAPMAAPTSPPAWSPMTVTHSPARGA